MAQADHGERPEHEVPGGSAPSSRFRRSVSEAGERIQEIVDAAERIAAEIEADARAQADAYLDEQTRAADQLFEKRADELKDLTADVLERAEGLLGEVRAVASEIERLVGQLRAEDGEEVRSDENGGAERPAPAAPAQDAIRQPGAITEAAVLRATQMAVAGSSREEIEEMLRREYGMPDPGLVADEILGPS